MRFLPVFALTATLVVPMVAPHALEAVAQQPYWQNGGKNLTASLKVDAVGTRVVHLSETLTQFLVCNKAGQLFDGTNCVAPGGNSLNISCPDGQYLKGINNNGADCRALPTGGGTPTTSSDPSLTIPACASGESLTSTDGKTLTCTRERFYTVSNTSPKTRSANQARTSAFCDAGDDAVSGGGACARCDAGGDGGCRVPYDIASAPYSKNGLSGWTFLCDLGAGDPTYDSVATYVTCRDNPPYKE